MSSIDPRVGVLTKFCHDYETFLDSVRKGKVALTAPVWSLISDSLDALGHDIESLSNGDEIDEHEELAKRFATCSKMDVTPQHREKTTVHTTKMPKMKWDESLSVGVKRFDDQHKTMIRSINAIHDSLKGSRNEETLKRLLKQLLGDTLEHFHDEEVELYRHDYPGFDEHKKAHDELVSKLRTFQARIMVGSTGKLTLAMALIFDYTKWFKNHVIDSDKKYTSFLISRERKTQKKERELSSL